MKEKQILIYNAVLDIINEEGFHSNIKISDIAKRANIGKGTVYEYFKSKDEIIAESIIYFLRNNTNNNLNVEEEKKLDFEKTFINHINRLSIVLAQNCNLHSLIVSQNVGSLISEDMKKQIKAKVLELKLEYDEVFNGMLKKGIDEGIISKNLEPFNVVTVQTTLISSIIQYIHTEGNDVYGEEEEFAHKLYKVIVKILS